MWIPLSAARARCAAGVVWPEDPNSAFREAIENANLLIRGNIRAEWYFWPDRFSRKPENSERPIGRRVWRDTEIPPDYWSRYKSFGLIIVGDQAAGGILRWRGVCARSRVDFHIEGLSARQDQIDMLWPPQPTGIARTGKRGRPSTKEWCANRAKELILSNHNSTSASNLAQILVELFKAEFPEESAPALNTIRNIVSPIVVEMKSRKPAN